MSNGQRKMLEVYTIIEKEGQEKSFWVRIGVAFENRDGSFNVHLNALPINGKLHIREKREKSDG